MPFTPKDWQDSPSTTSPITAAALEDLETRVTAYSEAQSTYYSFKQFSNLSFDGTTDVAPAINAALVSISAANDGNGGILVLPAGDAYLSQSIVLQNVTGIRGQGMRSTNLYLGNAVNDSVIKNYVSSDGIEANAMFCSVSDLAVVGNKANQTLGSGITFETYPIFTQTAGDYAFDPHQLVSNVYIYNCKENGFEGFGRSETRLINVYADSCDGYGFVPSFDSFLDCCSAGGNGLAGFYLNTSALRLTNCKSFYSGALTAASGHGFHVTGDSQVNFAGCESQDNKAHGYFFASTNRPSSMAACVADSNSTSSAGTYAGFAFSASDYNTLSACVAYERRANGATSYQTHALSIVTGSTGNRIDISHSAQAPATVSDAITTGSDSVAGNNIQINNEGGYQVGTYASTYTPNPYDGSTIAMTLTGNVTIAAVSSANMHIGSKLRFILTQDGTGSRTGTWNAAYKLAGGALTLTTTAAKTDVIDFEFNGTSWFETNRSLNL